MDQTFFAYQIAFRCERTPLVRRQLFELISTARPRQWIVEKSQFHQRLTGLLLEALPHADFGFWDLIRGADGRSEYDTWVGELEAIDEEGESGSVAAGDAPDGYQLVTVLFALDAGGISDRVAGERCDIAESDWFTRDTFAQLIATGPRLGFTSVRADAVYLVPGVLERAVPRSELEGDGYEYLHALA